MKAPGWLTTSDVMFLKDEIKKTVVDFQRGGTLQGVLDHLLTRISYTLATYIEFPVYENKRSKEFGKWVWKVLMVEARKACTPYQILVLEIYEIKHEGQL